MMNRLKERIKNWLWRLRLWLRDLRCLVLMLITLFGGGGGIVIYCKIYITEEKERITQYVEKRESIIKKHITTERDYIAKIIKERENITKTSDHNSELFDHLAAMEKRIITAMTELISVRISRDSELAALKQCLQAWTAGHHKVSESFWKKHNHIPPHEKLNGNLAEATKELTNKLTTCFSNATKQP